MKTVKNAYTALISMLLTALCWAVILAAQDMLPGGGRSILITDLSQQYIEYHAAVRGGGSLLFSWDSGMGINFLGLFAYYLSSPLTAVIFLFPESMLPTAILCIISLKIAVSAGTMSLWLGSLPHATKQGCLLFSLSYALSAYSMANCFNLMWLDGVILLPLLALTARQVYEKRRFFPFLCLLALLFLSNYYIAYAVGIFVFLLYLTWLTADLGQKALSALGRFFGAVILAAGLAAVLLLPAYFALQGSYTHINGFVVAGGIACPPQMLLEKWIFTPFDSATHSGTPNLFCGTAAVLLTPLFFCCRSIPKRERFVAGGLIAFMAVSMIFSATDLAWHAFQFPTWFVCRYSFTLIFFLCSCSARTLSEGNGITLSHRAAVTGGVILSVAVLGITLGVHWLATVITLCLLVLFALLLFLQKITARLPLLRHIGTVLLVLAVATQSVLGGVSVLRGLDEQLHFEQAEDYPAFRARSKQLVALLDTVDDGTFYRVGNATARNANDGLSAGYHAMSHYSSLSYQKTYRFMKRLGMHCTVNNKIFRYMGATSTLDAVMDVRYVFDTDDRRYGMRDTGVAYGDTRLYENKHVLPLMYLADDDVLQFTAEDGDPLAAQEALYTALTGEDIDLYTPLSVISRHIPGAIGKGATLTFTINNPTRQQVLLYFGNTLPEFSLVYVNGKRLNVYNDRLVRSVIDLGCHDAGQVVVTIPVTSAATFSQPLAYALCEDEYERAIAMLQSETPLQLSVDNTRIDCTVHARQQQVLFTSIPADAGWVAYIDGEKAAWQAVDGALMALPVPAGTHTVQWRFTPKGLLPGAIISGTTFCVCIALAVWLHLQKRKQKA